MKSAKSKIGRSAKGGRPPKYRDEFCELATNYALLGATDVEMAALFGVSESAFAKWKVAYPEFLHALKKGKEVADANVAKSLYRRAIGYSHEDTHVSNFQGAIKLTPLVKHYPPDTVAGIFWLKNRQRGKWSDKTEVAHTVSTIGELIDELQQ